VEAAAGEVVDRSITIDDQSINQSNSQRRVEAVKAAAGEVVDRSIN